jgi:hypothetical protein
VNVCEAVGDAVKVGVFVCVCEAVGLNKSTVSEAVGSSRLGLSVVPAGMQLINIVTINSRNGTIRGF